LDHVIVKRNALRVFRGGVSDAEYAVTVDAPAGHYSVFERDGALYLRGLSISRVCEFVRDGPRRHGILARWRGSEASISGYVLPLGRLAEPVRLDVDVAIHPGSLVSVL